MTTFGRRRLLAGAAALGMGAAAGCSSSKGSSSSLKVLVVKSSLTQPMAKMGWVADLQKLAGVTIEWQEITSDWGQKKAAMLSAGDIPDLMVSAVGDGDFATYGTLFTDLSQHLDALPNVQAMFDALPQTKSICTQPDGKVYSIGSYKRFWPSSATHQFINTTWLDRLGLEVPTTWDELFTVLTAFKTGNPTGDSKADVIPCDWSPVTTGGFGYFQPTVLMGSLGLPLSSGGGRGYFVEDKKVGSFLIDDRYRETVSFLNRLYAAGLINKEVMTHDYSTYQSVARGSGNRAAVGFSWGWTASDRFGTGVDDQYVSMSPLKVSAGDDTPLRWTYDRWAENFPGGAVSVSATTDKLDAALRVVNAFYDHEISMQVLWGDIGTNIKKTNDTTYAVLPPADKKSDSSTWKWSTTLADGGPFWIRDDLHITPPSDIKEVAQQTKPLAKALDNTDPDTDVYPSQFVKMKADDLNTLSLKEIAFISPAMNKFGEWVTKGGIDAEWDAYTAQLANAGLSQAVDIYQGYYDTYDASR